MDTDIKKEEDIKTEPKGIKCINIAVYYITFAINVKEKECNNYLNLLFRK